MSLLTQIVTKLPGFSSLAFMEKTIDQGTGTVLWDVATVIGTGIAVSTSGATHGQVTISVTGVYLLFGHAEGRHNSINNALIFRWTAGGDRSMYGIGGTNNLSQSSGSYSGITYGVTSITATTILTMATTVGGIGLEADGCWGLVARIS